MHKKVYGGIEAGGTKFVCGTGSGNGELLSRIEIKTSTPEQTISEIINFFKNQPVKIELIGVGSFGPIEININSRNYGIIQRTNKPGWSNFNFIQAINSKTDVPLVLVTDTDVAAIGELHHGVALNSENFVYLTIGTGIGGSIIQNSNLLHGISHPEMGHVPVSPVNNYISGTCNFHNSCLEGFASGKSIELLYGEKAENITNTQFWSDEANYIAQGIYSIASILQPELVVIGGSIIKYNMLIELIKSSLNNLNNDYIQLPRIELASSNTIGVLGAIRLASTK